MSSLLAIPRKRLSRSEYHALYVQYLENLERECDESIKRFKERAEAGIVVKGYGVEIYDNVESRSPIYRGLCLHAKDNIENKAYVPIYTPDTPTVEPLNIDTRLTKANRALPSDIAFIGDEFMEMRLFLMRSQKE